MTPRAISTRSYTHLLIANMTEYAGKWKALATDYIHNAGFIETVMKHQVTLGKFIAARCVSGLKRSAMKWKK
jgi:conjugative relaxase-like TrwC/TraI family protein